ncbi:hypothetical protein [Streptomyces chrestomyceticus]|uniref:hypothetical protein n=1 Tax=Streptomyces chrestomyceticus TaxID=68185 RepID=UPI0035A8280E
MATFLLTPRFKRDFAKLAGTQRGRFERVVREAFVPDLVKGAFRPGLRIKRVQATRDVWEMTWAPDGRATWQYGEEIRPGEPHIVWRRIGTHDVFADP